MHALIYLYVDELIAQLEGAPCYHKVVDLSLIKILEDLLLYINYLSRK